MRRVVLLLGALAGCQGGGDGPGDPASYVFLDNDGASTVSYTGQVLRHVLISDLNQHLDGITGRLNGGAFFPVAGQVAGELDFYLSFDSTIGGQAEILASRGFDAEQRVYDDLASGKNLREKLAGNDAVTDHRDWHTEFVGWDAEGATSPEALVDQWVAQIDQQAAAWNAAPPLDPSGVPVESVFLTPDGLDLQELLQKFLLGAVAYSQAADDYLDDDVDGKGLLADHEAVAEGKSYTALEHAWDEAFGYFGAARTAGDSTSARDNRPSRWERDSQACTAPGIVAARMPRTGTCSRPRAR